jgi:hypothetical protein
MATRRRFLLICLTLAGCRRTAQEWADLLPASVGDAWSRRQVNEVPAGAAPEEIRKMGLRRAAAAVYEGPARIDVTIYEMGSPASAFELIQKWRSAEGRMAFYRDRYFGVVSAPQAGRGTLAAFTQSLERSLNPG